MKMMHLAVMVLLVLLPVSGNSYELATHGRLTYAAYSQSVLVTDPEFTMTLGIADIRTFGPHYYDIAGAEARQPERNDFEESGGRMPEEVDPISLPGWLLRGAIREDDIQIARVTIGGNHDLDTYFATHIRVLNHFYDPVRNAPLTVGTGLGQTAPNWGLGTDDVLSAPGDANTFRDNHFTVRDAREAQYRALTGRGRVYGMDLDYAAPTHTERNKYWATTFRALGDVVHLIQDMAQPQHTRNRSNTRDLT